VIDAQGNIHAPLVDTQVQLLLQIQSVSDPTYHRATFYGYSFYEFGVYDLALQQGLKTLDGIQAIVDVPTKNVTIDGLVMNGKKEQVYVKVLDPSGTIQYTGQTTTGDDGSFRIAFTLTGEAQGIYTVELETDDMTTPEPATFEYRKPPANGDGNGGNGNGGNGGGGGGNGGATEEAVAATITAIVEATTVTEMATTMAEAA